MSDEHVNEFDHLFEAYTMLGLVPVDGWATADLVKLSRVIDVELQQRAEDQDYTVRNTSAAEQPAGYDGKLSRIF